MRVPIDEDPEQRTVQVTDGYAVMTIGAAEPFRDRHGWVNFLVSVSTNGLTAHRSVQSLDDPRWFLGAIAADWRGDDGDQTWASVERDVTIDAVRTLGYVSFGGNLDMAITLRTIVIAEGIAYVQAGAGVVADSQPEREFDETLEKAGAMFKAIEMAEAM